MSKLSEIDNVLGAATQILNENMEKASKEYHSYTEDIEEARRDGDTHRLTELKDKQEQAQKKYWEEDNKKKSYIDIAQQQKSEVEQARWNEQMQTFADNITTTIPDWNEEVAGEIRQFALDRGIPEGMINQMVDVNVIKFVDDFRRSEQSRKAGAVKREKAPVRTTPVKRGATPQEKQQAQASALTNKVLSGQGTQSEQNAFLRGLVSKHFE